MLSRNRIMIDAMKAGQSTFNTVLIRAQEPRQTAAEARSATPVYDA
ncbi:MAG: hypothetical protein IT318_23170 [Anaerolineales bacterium]|nr:hypothetical protein [Anaerolineales bacterium]